MIAAEHFSGGSQAIAFDGGWLALVHEARATPSSGQRYYQHRFVWFDQTNALRRVSRAFFFHQKDSVEFAAGLAWHPDGNRLLLSYGAGDKESWIAAVDAAAVGDLLEDTARLPFGLPVRRDTATPAASDADRDAELGRSAANRSGPNRSGTTPRRQYSEGRPLAGGTVSGVGALSAEVDSPAERRRQSREFDARIAPFLNGDGTAALPQIHCFYEVLSDTAQHHTLIAATASMRAAGHPVRVWSYSPEKLEFLRPHGVELRRRRRRHAAAGSFERIVAGSEIRYFSDMFRYAVLYEHGGLWMDTDVVLLRPFPFRGDHFLNLQWRGGHQEHFICGNVMYAEPYSRHMRNLYEMSIDRFFAVAEQIFGDVGPKLLSDYVASEAGAELSERLFSPVFFNPIDWTELDRFDQPIGEVGRLSERRAGFRHPSVECEAPMRCRATKMPH